MYGSDSLPHCDDRFLGLGLFGLLDHTVCLNASMFTLTSHAITHTGLLGYMAFGPDVHVIVLKSLPVACNGNPICAKFVAILQYAYCAAVFIGWPLMLVPPVRITEKWLFGKERRSGKKWLKNAWRAFIVIGLISFLRLPFSFVAYR